MQHVWVYWQNKPTSRATPDYIELCHQTMRQHADGVQLHVLNEDTIHDYLDDLEDDLDEITVRHLGREFVSVSHKVDVLRARLLQKYGGVYLDSDTIVLRPLSDLLDRTRGHDFTCTRIRSTGENTIPNGFLASAADGKVINAYCARLEARLEQGGVLSWCALGSDILTPIVDTRPEFVSEIAEADIMPVSWMEKDRFAEDIALEDIVTSKTYTTALYHGAFGRRIHEVPRQTLLDDQTLIGRLFRAALREG